MQANADPYYLLGKKRTKKIWFLYRTRHFQITWFGKPHNKCNWEVTRVLFLKEGACLVYGLCSAPPFVFGEHPRNPLFPENQTQSFSPQRCCQSQFILSLTHSPALSFCLSLPLLFLCPWLLSTISGCLFQSPRPQHPERLTMQSPNQSLNINYSLRHRLGKSRTSVPINKQFP